MSKFDGKVVVDVHCECNRNVLFWPLSMNLYSEKKQSEIRSMSVPGWLGAIGGVIPGHRMVIDFKTGKGQVIDKVFLPENSAILSKIRELGGHDDEDDMNNRFRRGSKSEKPYNFVIPEGREATFLFHMRNLVDTGRFELVSGTIPSREEILQMGRCEYGEAWTGLDTKPGYPSQYYHEPRPSTEMVGAR